MKILLANPRGFCAGVDRAITIVETALLRFGAPIYVRHEVVHNRYVVENLEKKGVIFVEELSNVPEGSILVFSAHGVSLAIREEAKKRNLHIFDATCPLVTKVHMQVARASRTGDDIILIGHAGHIEVEGTMGQYTNKKGNIFLIENREDIKKIKLNQTENLRFVTQTTLSVDDTAEIINDLAKYFPQITRAHKNDICYATTNRQKAVKILSNTADIVFVVGSKNSSNSNRLAELVKRNGKKAYLIDNADDICNDWFFNKKDLIVGVTAGASAPENLVQDVLKKLCELGGISIEEIGFGDENIVFELPKNL